MCRIYGQPYGLTTGAWTTLRIAPNLHKPQQQEEILFLAGMKEKDRVGFKR
jgi:hypothetical protein